MWTPPCRHRLLRGATDHVQPGYPQPASQTASPRSTAQSTTTHRSACSGAAPGRRHTWEVLLPGEGPQLGSPPPLPGAMRCPPRGTTASRRHSAHPGPETALPLPRPVSSLAAQPRASAGCACRCASAQAIRPLAGRRRIPWRWSDASSSPGELGDSPKSQGQRRSVTREAGWGIMA